MKYVLCVAISLCLLFKSEGHDHKLAWFNIQTESGRLVCHLRADRIHTIKALNYAVSKASIQEYLKNHLLVQVDSSQTSLVISEYTLSGEFIDITIDLGRAVTTPGSIKVRNDFLTNEVTGHENVLMFNFYEEKRSFRMNRERTEIFVALKRS